jgi:hypothetical protein
MAKKKQDNTGFVQFDNYDPAVEALIDQVEQKRSDARLPRKQRQKKAKARAKDKARLERRVNWDLPVDLKQRIIALAEQYEVPTSQVAAFLLIEGLHHLEAGKIDPDDYKILSHSPRYAANLDLDTLQKQKNSN